MSIGTHKTKLGEALLAYRQGRYTDCYKLVRSIEDHGPLSAALLVLKGRCIQLLRDEGVPLEDSLDAFADALLIDPESIDALLESGYYHLNVQDDPQNETRDS